MSTIKTTTLSTQGGSTVPVDTVVNGTAKAWVNFNGTGTVAIRRAFNVSSITDNGTGDYTVNFTTAMVDVNYSPQITSGWTPGVDNSSFPGVRANGITTTTMRFSNVNNGDAAYDSTNLNVAIFS
tara:strand:+ start:1119 stop:1493 length:375 start_codon:yes stop_codon:yes gene_type:complete